MPVLADDPQNYAKMGSRLWNALASRQSEQLPPELLPYYVFTDGDSLAIIPKAFVAGFRVSNSNPLAVVLPGPKTAAESEKYRLLTMSQFLEKNSMFVNKVGVNNPARQGMLNIYMSSAGVPTTRQGAGLP
jgi:hypothetical protein